MANHPIIVVKGSGICDEYFKNFNNPKGVYSEPSIIWIDYESIRTINKKRTFLWIK